MSRYTISRMTYIEHTTVADEELMKVIKFDPTFTKPTITSLTLEVSQDCTVIINGHSEVKVKQQYGLIFNHQTIRIESLIVKDAGVDIYAIIGY